MVSAKLAALECAEDAEVFSSGMAAISTTLMSFLSKGDHIVATPDCYGGTYGLLTEILPRMGIEVTMADVRQPSSYGGSHSGKHQDSLYRDNDKPHSQNLRLNCHRKELPRKTA